MTLCAATFADDTTEILNGQINLNAAILAVTEGQADQVDLASQTASAMANAASIDVITPHDVENDQQFDGDVVSRATTQARAIDGLATTTATSHGNSLSVLADDTLDIRSTQTAADGASIAAEATLAVEDYVMHSVTTAGANANTYQGVVYGGETNLDLRQDSGARVTADAYVTAPTGGLGDTATIAAGANGNSILSEGYYQAPSQIVEIDQENRGEIRARARADAGGGSVATTVIASARGNEARIQNEDGYAHMQGQQSNSGTVTAQSEAAIPHFDVDVVTLGSEAIGNSVVISNFGADAYNGVGQTNTGTILAQTRQTGNEGGAGFATATAFGNAASTYICSECPVTAYGTGSQTNSGSVTAVSSQSVNTAPYLTGSATAIGNSATYQTRQPD